jgi:hypothetical protein
MGLYRWCKLGEVIGEFMRAGRARRPYVRVVMVCEEQRRCEGQLRRTGCRDNAQDAE